MEEFIVPHSGDYIFYSPLKRKVILINSPLKSLIERIDCLDETELDEIQKNALDKFRRIVGAEIKPIDERNYETNWIVILPTFKCNLECIYCYSQENRSDATMSVEIAKAGIDHVLDTKISEDRKLSLMFHGGGEPTLAWDVITSSFEYARARCDEEDIKLKSIISTNGVVERKQLDWLIENIDVIQVSFDGLENIQNKQRPCRKGKPSFDLVYKTLKYLNEKNKDYLIRSTVTAESVVFLEESVKYMIENFAPQCIHLEPVSLCGGCKTNNLLEVNGHQFAEKFAKLHNQIKTPMIFYSNSDILRLRKKHCGACGDNFILTPEGYVSTCLEVSSPDDDMGDFFIVGKYDEKSKRFIISEDKISRLKNRSVDNIPYCSDCFVKYNCAGDCPARVFRESRNIFDTSVNKRCEINQEIGKARLIEILSPDDH